jgi:large subunit ribosomal protein L25
LDFNDNIRWHDLKGTENVKSAIDRDFVVATVVPPTKIEAVAEAAVAGAPSAPAAPAKGGTRAPGKAPAKK